MKLPLQEFADVLEGLQDIMSQSDSENRRASRMSVTARVQIHVNEAGRWHGYAALTKDVSISGMGLLQSRIINEGQEVVVQLPRKKDPLYMGALVTHCQTLADGILAVGLQFCRRLSEQEVGDIIQQAKDELARLQHAVLG
jgi:hypothetical protein